MGWIGGPDLEPSSQAKKLLSWGGFLGYSSKFIFERDCVGTPFRSWYPAIVLDFGIWEFYRPPRVFDDGVTLLGGNCGCRAR